MVEEIVRRGERGFSSVELMIECGIVIAICVSAIVVTQVAGMPTKMAGPIALAGIALVVLVAAMVRVVPSLAVKRPAAGASVFKGPDGLNFMADTGIRADQLPAVLIRIVEFL
jgi:hypothetical protein